MPPIYAVVNQKGGVGKTTTAVNVAAGLAALGSRVLLVDLDPQANATSGLGLRPNHGNPPKLPGIYEILVDELPAKEAITPTAVNNLWMIPSRLDLAGAEVELMPRISREMILAHALAPIVGDFDSVLIDAPPSLGVLTMNALAAADFAIIPIQCEYYALEGVGQILQTIDLVKRRINPRLEIGMVVLTMFDPRIRLNMEVRDEVRRAFGDRVATTVIPRNIRIAEAPSRGLPVTIYEPRSRGARAYVTLAQEVFQHGENPLR